MPTESVIRDKVIRDAVHGDLAFTRDELRLIDTPGFQRLRGIKQLGTSYLIYPSAVHDRFEHSLGVCAMAERILAGIEAASGIRFSPDERRLVRAAALLHDITHVPFGHTFEDERRIFDRHDEDAARLDHILSVGGIEPELARQGLADDLRSILLKGETRHPLARDIVAGTICADLLDYLRRDAFHCGLAQNFDDRVFSLFIRVGDRLALDLQKDGLLRHDALSELIHLLRIRYSLTERVYFHHAKVAAGAMVSKALELALDAGLFRYEELFDLGDESFLYVLRSRGANHPAIAALLDGLRRRALYKRAYLLTLGETDQPPTADQQADLERRYHFNTDGARAAAEADLCRAAGLPDGSVIVYCPSAKMSLKEARVQVKIDDATVCSLAELNHPEIKVLLDKHRRLWRFYVFVRSDGKEHFPAIADACEKLFGLPNMLPRQTRGQLAFPFRIT